jgi:hypothetical protein
VSLLALLVCSGAVVAYAVPVERFPRLAAGLWGFSFLLSCWLLGVLHGN